mgnify:CR=1 FL=1
MRLRIALSVIPAFAALVITDTINPTALTNWVRETSPVPRLSRRGDFDPSKYADQTTWDKYVKKGNHLLCLMAASDRAAGYLEQDTRDPPSAASKWTGDLRSVY